MSFIIPARVYQNSWYSIVSETNVGRFNFMTEKTAKCLFGKRIFVCFNSPGHLKFLRDQGFKTFDKWIDESYDSEENGDKRMDMIIKEVKKLNDMDTNQLDIMLEEMKEVLVHNQKHLMTFNYKSNLI